MGINDYDENNKKTNAESEEDQLRFFMKVGTYIRNHPEFMEELEERIAEDENPEYKKNDLNYFMKKGFKGMKGVDVESVASQVTSVFFEKDNNNKSLLEQTAQDAFSKLISGYLSKYIGKL